MEISANRITLNRVVVDLWERDRVGVFLRGRLTVKKRVGGRVRSVWLGSHEKT